MCTSSSRWDTTCVQFFIVVFSGNRRLWGIWRRGGKTAARHWQGLKTILAQMDPQNPNYAPFWYHLKPQFMQQGNPSNMHSNLCILKHSFSNFIFLSARPISERCLELPKPGCLKRGNAGERITLLASLLGDVCGDWFLGLTCLCQADEECWWYHEPDALGVRHPWKEGDSLGGRALQGRL